VNRRAFMVALPALALTLEACSTPGLRLDAPYVSTPHAVVDEMLRLARVQADDIVYDLGCGDGRFVIAAADRFGARGVGIDIDPLRIAQATGGAVRAGVATRVSFRREDLFEADFTAATVVTLFLMTELNARLAPKLRALRPGSRIVAYEYGIPGWTADEVTRLDLDGHSHSIMLWRVG